MLKSQAARSHNLFEWPWDDITQCYFENDVTTVWVPTMVQVTVIITLSIHVGGKLEGQRFFDPIETGIHVSQESYQLTSGTHGIILAARPTKTWYSLIAMTIEISIMLSCKLIYSKMSDFLYNFDNTISSFKARTMYIQIIFLNKYIVGHLSKSSLNR